MYKSEQWGHVDSSYSGWGLDAEHPNYLKITYPIDFVHPTGLELNPLYVWRKGFVFVNNSIFTVSGYSHNYVAGWVSIISGNNIVIGRSADADYYAIGPGKVFE